MADYQRFVSYIYSYPGGVKDKNVGFAKLEIENGYMQELGEHEEEYVPKWDI